MELRNMSHGWSPVWPPEWQWTSGADNTHPVGEIGVLENVQVSNIDPNACFLTINDNGATYVGRLHFDQQGICQKLCELLKYHNGRPIKEIGELDIPVH